MCQIADMWGRGSDEPAAYHAEFEHLAQSRVGLLFSDDLDNVGMTQLS